jgi:hypothetical protein
MRLPRLLLPVMLAAVLLAVAGCGGSSSKHAASAGTTSTQSHVVVLVMENEDASDVLTGRYTQQLASTSAVAKRYFAIAHPSLPNYLALTGGSTFGVKSDCTDCGVNAPNIVDQLEAAHLSWRAYMGGMPKPCDTAVTAGVLAQKKHGAIPLYVKKEDPFLYYHDIVANPARCAHVVPETQLAADIKGGQLPTFVWITPNQCENGHSCSLKQSDSYLAGVVPSLLGALGPHGVLFLTWDEGNAPAPCNCHGEALGGNVLALAAGPDARRGGVATQTYDHYSLLRTVEDILGLPHLGRAGAPTTHAMDALFTQPPRVR